MGSFSLTVNLTSGHLVIAAHKLPPQHRSAYWDKRYHPHLYNYGPCWGNIRSAIAELSRDREYAALIHLARNFLDTGDDGHIASWLQETGVRALSEAKTKELNLDPKTMQPRKKKK